VWNARYRAIRSAGERLVLDPLAEEYERHDDPDNTAGTEFVFPWRMRETELSQDIGAEPWNRSRIDEFLAILERDAVQNLLFLRNLREIVVVDARDRRSAQRIHVTKRRIDIPGFTSEYQFAEQFQTDLAGSDPLRETWTYLGRPAGSDKYRSVGGESKKIKNALVQIAFSDAPPAVSRPGILFNTLPTPVTTGFGFHINGDFYPTSDRTSILTGDDDMGAWNKTLIKAIATMAGVNLPTIRDRAGSWDAFYRLLPVAHSSACPYLEPIVEGVRREVRNGAFAWTVGGWSTPKAARTPDTAQIATLVAPAGKDIPKITPTGLPDAVREYLDIPSYGLIDLATDLKPLAKQGTRLDHTTPILNTRERLSQLLRAFDRGIGNPPDSALRAAVRGLNLALDESGYLRRLDDQPGNPMLASDNLRDLLPPHQVSLIDRGLQKAHGEFLRRFVHTIDVRDVVKTWRATGAGWVGQHNISTRSMFRSSRGQRCTPYGES